MTSRRIYRHFCMMARTLELVGERWSLLIVRELLLGPRRFTDLSRSLGEITPTRLTSRLRQLESAGIVAREPPSAGREVWYRLTDAGLDLGPVVEALTQWGIEHALEPPRPDESVHAAPVMIGTKVWLQRFARSPSRSLIWRWRFADDEPHTLRFDQGRWTLARGDTDAADVTVDAALEAWARFLAGPSVTRRLPAADIRLEGRPAAIEEFAETFAPRRRGRNRRAARP